MDLTMSHKLLFKGYIKGTGKAYISRVCAQKGCSRCKAADEWYRYKSLGKVTWTPQCLFFYLRVIMNDKI